MQTIKETVAYEKTHNKTGKKYFGISTRDTNNYNGSGPRWIEHLEEHGNDHSTEILFKTTSQQELTDFCEAYSKEKDIVESDLYANVVAEHGGCVGGEANPNYKDGKWVGRHDDKELERRVQKEADAIKYKTKEYMGLTAGKLRISSVSTGKYVMPYFLNGFLTS